MPLLSISYRAVPANSHKNLELRAAPREKRCQNVDLGGGQAYIFQRTRSCWIHHDVVGFHSQTDPKEMSFPYWRVLHRQNNCNSSRSTGAPPHHAYSQEADEMSITENLMNMHEPTCWYHTFIICMKNVKQKRNKHLLIPPRLLLPVWPRLSAGGDITI